MTDRFGELHLSHRGDFHRPAEPIGALYRFSFELVDLVLGQHGQDYTE